jgi:hypothetical protein
MSGDPLKSGVRYWQCCIATWQILRAPVSFQPSLACKPGSGQAIGMRQIFALIGSTTIAASAGCAAVIDIEPLMESAMSVLFPGEVSTASLAD